MISVSMCNLYPVLQISKCHTAARMQVSVSSQHMNDFSLVFLAPKKTPTIIPSPSFGDGGSLI